MYRASKLRDVLWRRCAAWCPGVLKETAEVRCSTLGLNLLNTLLGAPRVLGKTHGLLHASCLAAGIPVPSLFLMEGQGVGVWGAQGSAGCIHHPSAAVLPLSSEINGHQIKAVGIFS